MRTKMLKKAPLKKPKIQAKKRGRPKKIVHELLPAKSDQYPDSIENPFKRKKIAFERAISRNIARPIFTDQSLQAVCMDSANVNQESFSMDSNVANTQQLISQPTVSEGILNWFGSLGFIGYQLCGIISQHWLVDKSCTTPARDAMRNGFETTINNGQEVDQSLLDSIRQYDIDFNLNDNCVQFSRNARVFGIRIAMFKIDCDNPVEFYGNPFNIDGVRPGSYKGISQIDPYWITPELDKESSSDPSSMHFYEPTWWRVNGMRIHRTHLIINIPYPLPDILRPTYMYGGISLTQKIYERVYAAERTANEAPMLTMTKRLNIMSTDISVVSANPIPFENRLLMLNRLRDNYGILAKDKDNELYEQMETSLADLDAVIMTQYQIVAAIANVPVSKLMGITLKGFNTTGEYEEKSYHEELKSIQAHELTPLVQRHHELVIKSCIAPENPFPTSIEWNPLNIPTDEEVALINKTKAETAVALSSVGAIDGIDERDRIINDPASGYNGIEAKDEQDMEPLEPQETEVPSDVNDPANP